MQKRELLIGLALICAFYGGMAIAFPESTKGAKVTQDTFKSATFAADIAPIFYRHCVSCHRPGGPTPFSLLRYEDARPRARAILKAVLAGVMPPWLPAPGHGEFAGERILEHEEVELIREWVDTGAGAGDLTEQPPAPNFPDGWQLGPPDLVVEMPEEYTLAAEGENVFRNFVIPVGISEPRWVRTMDLRPGSQGVVHHAVMMIDHTSSSRILDEADPGPGFGGMDAFSRADRPEGHLLGWTPGKVPYQGDEGIAWGLDVGSDIVLQLHMIPSGDPTAIRASLGFYYSHDPPEHSPYSLRLGSKTIDIPPGESRYEFSDDYLLPVDVDLLSIYPHAHYLGNKMESWAILPDGSRHDLLRIDDWDFNWQDEYHYKVPLYLPAGTQVSMRFSYDNTPDNSQNPNSPPRRVVWGPKSSDEMGDLWLRVLPRKGSDLSTLDLDFRRKDLRADLDGYRFAVELNPHDAEAQNRLGSILQVLGRWDEAADHYRRALNIEPELVTARYNLATVEQYQGNLNAAISQYERALEAKPDFAQAHSNLGIALAALGQAERSIFHYRRAIESDPEYAEAYNNLGVVLLEQGELKQALELLQMAIRINPDYAKGHNHLGVVLVRLGRLDEAIEKFRRAIALDPRYADARDNLETVLRIERQGHGDEDEGQP